MVRFWNQQIEFQDASPDDVQIIPGIVRFFQRFVLVVGSLWLFWLLWLLELAVVE